VKIGVFDSGVGGLSVAHAIQKALPEHEFLLREDKENLPYGTKSPEQLLSLVRPILEEMVHGGCNIIVIACNTVTTTIINQLRELITVPLIGMEPMVKPAAETTKTGVIAVFATPATLKSDRYRWLKNTYASGVKVIEPDCSRWAKMIEDDQIDINEIKTNTEYALQAGADVLVLGCTHYHWIEELIRGLANNRASVIQPEQPAINQLKKELARLG
jgi:glutamate racemase